MKNLIISAIFLSGLMISGCGGQSTGNTAADLSNGGVNAAATPTPTATEPTGNSELPPANTEAADTQEFVGTTGKTDKRNIDIKAPGMLREVRTGAHGNFDRITFEFSGPELPGYHIEYIQSPVSACGSGNAVPFLGNGMLEVRFTDAQAHTPEGEPTITDRDRKPLMTAIRQLTITCDFEGEVTWVAGVPEKRNYRVTELTNPTRLAVDIKHK